MNGQACIRGMRLTVRRVLEVLAVYPDRAELRREYPELEDDDVAPAPRLRRLQARRSGGTTRGGMIALLLDQGLPRALPSFSATRDGMWSTSELGFSHATDRDILDLARAQSGVCVTCNADFHAMLALADASGPSVIRIRIEGLRAEQVATLLTTVWPRIAADLEVGAVVSITAQSVRVRRLPLGGGDRE